MSAAESPSVVSMRCGSCEALFRLDINIATGKPIWVYPKAKRGGCKHRASSIEVLMSDDTNWTARDVLRPEPTP